MPKPLEVGEPDLDERSHGILEARLPGCLQRVLVARTHLGRIDALLEPVVTGNEELLDPLPRVATLHKPSVTGQSYDPRRFTGLCGGVTTSPKSIRVLIADDHRLFAQALEAILARDKRLEVVGDARDGREAVELAGELRPDVVLMDIAMPVMDGFQATREIRKLIPGACVLMLTGSNSRSDVDRARKAGAAGYVTKDRIAAELIDAIMEVVSRD